MARTRKARAAAGNKDGDSNGQQGGNNAAAGDSSESSANVSPVRELNGSTTSGTVVQCEGNNCTPPPQSGSALKKDTATANQAQNGLLNGYAF